MRYLILSDIHGNWQGLEAVLDSAAGAHERIVCCGDLVGYGADPNLVTAWVRDNVAGVVRGNHDKACAGLDDLEWFNPVARQSAVWTLHALQPENLKYLRALEKGPLAVNGFNLVHGSPLDEDEYMINIDDVAQVAPYLEANLSFFGHTHVQGAFICHTIGVQRIQGPGHDAETVEIEIGKSLRYLVNPGSVGQPRDGDPRAGYAIYDSEQRVVTLHRVAYDVQGAQKQIVDAGLPGVLALRLATGN